MDVKGMEQLLDPGETALAAVKSTPRGSAHEWILGAAGGVAGGSVTPGLAGPGFMAGSSAAAAPGEAGRAERADAGLDVGKASQVALVVTDRRLVLCSLSWRGKPKEVLAALPRSEIATVAKGTTRICGQSMTEIVVTTASGAEAGFGVARVNRGDGDRVLAALDVA